MSVSKHLIFSVGANGWCRAWISAVQLLVLNSEVQQPLRSSAFESLTNFFKTFLQFANRDLVLVNMSKRIWTETRQVGAKNST